MWNSACHFRECRGMAPRVGNVKASVRGRLVVTEPSYWFARVCGYACFVRARFATEGGTCASDLCFKGFMMFSLLGVVS